MKNANPILVPELREMLAHGNETEIRDFCSSAHPASIAEMVSALLPEEAWEIIRRAEPNLRSEIFIHFHVDFQVQIINKLKRSDIAKLVADLPPDERADLFKHMPDEIGDAILPALAQAEREDIRRLSSYEEGTAGAVMTSDYATLRPELTASQGIDRLREVAPDRETIYYAYIVDDKRRILGLVSLKDLIVARRDAKISDIMYPDVITVHVEDDQEDVARKIQKYNLLAIPVVDGENAIVGIITHDDAIDIITQEQTEDMKKFMAIVGSHEDEAYLKTSIWRHFRNRSPWILILAVLGLVSGFIIQSFENLLMQFTILAAFMPMLVGTGGNTGSQSATLVVRALALKEISPKDVLRILFREFRVSILLALVLGVIAYGRVLLFGGGDGLPDGTSLFLIGFAISLALAIQVVLSTLIGALLPLGAALFKKDPAVIASPTLSTIVDITGLLIFFTTIKVVLGI